MPIKLPSMTSGPVQKFARKDVNQPLREAEQTRQLTQAVTSAITTGVKLKAEHDISQSDLQVKSEVDQFERDNKATEFFDRETLKADGFDTSQFDVLGGDNTQPIPRDQVYADLYKKKMDDSLKLAATKISNPRQRELWLQDKQAIVETNYTKAVVQGLKDQQVRFQKERVTGIATAIGNNEFSVARDINEQIADPALRKKMGEQIGKSQELQTYEEPLRTDDLQGMKDGLAKLQADEYKDKGKLDTQENIAEQARLRAGIGRLEARNKAKLSANKSIINNRIVKGKDQLFSGKPVNDMDTLMQNLSDGDAVDSNRVNRMENRTALHTYPVMQNILARPQSVRNQLWDDYKRSPHYKQLSATEQLLADKKGKASIDSANREQQEDNLQWYSEQNNIELPPLDVDNLATGIAARNALAVEAQDATGMETSLMTDPEAANFSRDFMLMDDRAKISTMVQAKDQLGDDFYKLTDPMSKYLPGYITVSANLAAQNKPYVAEEIMAGQRAIDEGVIDLKSPITFDTGFSDSIGGAYSAVDGVTGDMKNSINAMYASIALRDGDLSGDFDQNIYDDAVEAVTGGLTTYNGRNIPPLFYGASTESFSGWIESIPLERIKGAGGIDGIPHVDKFIEGVETGNLQPVSYGDGRYVFRDINTGSWLVQTATTKPFVLGYEQGDSLTAYVPPRQDRKTVRDIRRGSDTTPAAFAKLDEAKAAEAEADAIMTEAKMKNEEPGSPAFREMLKQRQSEIAERNVASIDAKKENAKAKKSNLGLGF